jgi:TolB-like protein/Tfp pilus assembly protein PilF
LPDGSNETASAPADPLLERVRAALADRYDVEREIGRGGMGTVYLSRDLHHDRHVAVKVMRPDAGACCDTDRFLLEIRIAARLAHPGIVPLLDSGERHGLLWFTMPWLEAPTLREVLDERGRMPVDEALRIARGLAAALDYAHRHGVVHRDIKPENVLLHEGGPMLADFGVARALTAAEREEGAITDRGVAVGTPAYMSPEQASGDSNLDGRSDQYSLACVVFEILAGEALYPGRSPRSVIRAHVTEPPRPLRTVRPEAPAAVDAALRRALAKDPAERFATAVEFAEALSAPDSSVAPLVGRDVAVAVLPFDNLSADRDAEYLSDGITDELIHALSMVDGLRVASRTSAYAYKGRAEDVRSIGARLGVAAILEGSVRQAGRRLRVTARLTRVSDGKGLWAERFDREADDIFAIEDEITGTIVRTLRAMLLGPVGEPAARRYTASPAAYRLYLQGRHAWGRRSAEGMAEAMRLFEAALAEDPNCAVAWTGLSDAHAQNADYSGRPVGEGLARAREMARRALELDESLAEAHASLAWVLFIHDWDWEGTFRHFRRAIELDPAYASAHQWYAFPLIAHGRIPEGLAEARLARELDPASVAIRRSLGWAYYYARRYDEAAEHLRRAIAMNPTAEESHRALGYVHLASGDLDAALAALREALAAGPSSTYAAGGLGAALARSGRGAEAGAVLSDLEKRARAGYVSPAPFAMIALGLGDHERACAEIERTLAERRGWVVYLRVDPMFDPLRSDPRFQGLISRMRLGRG